MTLLDQIKQNAKKNKKRIVLPEGTSERTIKAADIILKEGIADLILLGNLQEIAELEKKFGLDLSKAEKIDPLNSPKKKLYIERLVELRKSKGLTPQQAD